MDSSVVLAGDPTADQALPSKRQRDITRYVMARRVRPVVLAQASLINLDAEAYARAVGNWGDASAHVGKKWEQVATAWARDHSTELPMASLHSASDVHICELDGDPAIHREIERVGVSCPDLVVCSLSNAEQAVVHAVDCKVSLDTASFDQVDSDRLADLVRRGGDLTVQALWDALVVAGWHLPDVHLHSATIEPRTALQLAMETGAVVVAPGLFFSPDTAFNRSHLASKENRQRKRPLLARDIVLISLPTETFLGDLPGWPAGVDLARLDHLDPSGLKNLGRMEQYYRLGAGALGALTLIHTPLFAERPSEQPGVVAAFLESERWKSSVEVLQVLDGLRSQRVELNKRRDALLRFPVGFFTIVEMAAKAAGKDHEPTDYRDLAVACQAALAPVHRAAMRERGSAIVAEGKTDVDALTQLEEEYPTLRGPALASCAAWLGREVPTFAYRPNSAPTAPGTQSLLATTAARGA